MNKDVRSLVFKVDQLVPCVFVCVRTITFKLNNSWLRYPTSWFISTLSKPGSTVLSQSSR